MNYSTVSSNNKMIKSEKKKRSGNISEEQRNLLTEYMTNHPNLVSGKFSKTFTVDHAAKLWQEIAEILNACNGAEKNWKAWRKCWQDFRSRSKSKQGEINVHRRQTGGGELCTTVLTPDEEKVMSLIPKNLTDGHSTSRESTTEMQLNEEDDDVIIKEVEYFDMDSTTLKTMAFDNDIEFLEENYDIVKKSMLADINDNKENTFDAMGKKKDNNIESDAVVNGTRGHSTAKCTKTQGKKPFAIRKLEQTKEASDNLVDIANKDYKLKQEYYKQKLEYIARCAKAKERIASAAERCQMS
ncbi:uncharacterized protein LOC143902951 [Temnothorax americanus]|uniref:uncharacterized protein LOC143902951 n=1 Tax=Temnothorax americanus TaxID=1964332 RepID=UPI004067BAC0